MNRYPELPPEKRSPYRVSPIREKQALGLRTAFTPARPVDDRRYGSPERSARKLDFEHESYPYTHDVARPKRELSPSKSAKRLLPSVNLEAPAPMLAAKRRLDDIARSPARRHFTEGNKENHSSRHNDNKDHHSSDLQHVVVELQEIVKTMQSDYSRRIAELEAKVDRQQIVIDRLRRRY